MTIASYNVRPVQTSTVQHLFWSGPTFNEARPPFEVTYKRQVLLLNSTHASAEAPVVSSR